MVSVLYPVIRRVPEEILSLTRRKKVHALSADARESARASALKSAISISEFKKDEQGIPMPTKGIFWSVSHKQDAVAGVVAKHPVGIDLEIVKPVSDSLFRRIVSQGEFACFDTRDRELAFFRSFTAKEAVLKRVSVGISGLLKTKIETVMDARNLMVSYQKKKYWVENFYSGRYLAAITKDQCEIQWFFE